MPDIFPIRATTDDTTNAGYPRKRRRRRQQIPSIAVTEGRVQKNGSISAPPRKLGVGGKTKSERMAISNRIIEEFDGKGRPQWEMAAATGLSTRQVRRRLKSIHERREAKRIIQREIDDLAIPG